MSVLSQFFTGGRFITDPTLFSRISRPSPGIVRDVASSNALFWTGGIGSIDRIPGSVQVNSDWTADTYKTIASLTTKAGLVSHFIGPTLTTDADTCTMRITIDGGSAVTIVLTAQENTTRVMLGLIRPTGLFTVADTQLLFDAVPSDDLTAELSSSSVSVDAPQQLLYWGAPLLRFTSSLLVEMKASTNITGTASQQRRAGVVLIRTA